MLRDNGRRGRDFHLLQHLRWKIEQFQLPAAVGTTIQRVRKRLVDRLGRELRPQMLFVARLSRAVASARPRAEAWAA